MAARQYCNENAFDDISNPKVRYWIGFLLADGNVHGNRLRLELQYRDIDHLRKFKKFLDSGHTIHTPIRNDGHHEETKTAVIRIRSTKMTNKLAEFGIVPQKTHTVKPDPRLANDPDFWRGVIDGDGSIIIHNKSKTTKVVVCGNPYVCEGFGSFCRNLTGTKAKMFKTATTHIFSLSGSQQISKAVPIIYPHGCTCLDRKYKKAWKIVEMAEKCSLRRAKSKRA